MSFEVHCPQCGNRRQVPDEVVGKKLRCIECRAVFRANSPDFEVVEDAPRRRRRDDEDRPVRKLRRAEPDDRPKRGQARRRSKLPLLLGLVGLVVLIGGGLAVYFVIGRTTPTFTTEYQDPKGLFTARFPNKPTEETGIGDSSGRRRVEERKAWATVGKAEYTVTVLGPFVPERTIGPRWRDHQIISEVAHAGKLGLGQVVDQNSRTVDGHAATQVVTFQLDGPIMAGLFVASERYVLRITVTDRVSGAKQAQAFKAAAEQFFDTIHVGPEFGQPLNQKPPQTPVEEVLAAYRQDVAAADARFKDRWLDLTGRVASVEFIPSGLVSKVRYEAGGQTMTCSFSGENRGPINAGDTIAVTGQCKGLVKSKGGPALNVEFVACQLLTSDGDMVKYASGPRSPMNESIKPNVESGPGKAPGPTGPGTTPPASGIAETKAKLVGRWEKVGPGKPQMFEFRNDGTFRLLVRDGEGDEWEPKYEDARWAYSLPTAASVKVKHGSVDNPDSPIYELYRITRLTETDLELVADATGVSYTTKLTRAK